MSLSCEYFYSFSSRDHDTLYKSLCTHYVVDQIKEWSNFFKDLSVVWLKFQESEGDHKYWQVEWNCLRGARKCRTLWTRQCWVKRTPSAMWAHRWGCKLQHDSNRRILLEGLINQLRLLSTCKPKCIMYVCANYKKGVFVCISWITYNQSFQWTSTNMKT